MILRHRSVQGEVLSGVWVFLIIAGRRDRFLRTEEMRELYMAESVIEYSLLEE